MAIVLAATQQFLLSANPPVLRFSDTTDYSGSGASHSDTIIGLLQVYDPSGAILYQNSHYGDTTPSSGDLVPYSNTPVTFIDITLPIDPATNLPEQGNYTVNYRVYVHQASGSTLNGNYTITKVYNVCPVIPEVDIDITVDCICGKFTSVDNTDYGAYDSLTRVHTVKYPGGVPLSPEVSALANITAALYTGTYTSIITSTVTYGALTFIVTGSVEQKINCAKSICDVSCQIFTLQDAYFDALKYGTPNFNAKTVRDLKAQLDEVTMFMQGISMAMDCGQTDKINDLLDRVYTVGNFTPQGCGCDDDIPRLVTGCGNVITGNTYSVITSNGLASFAVTSGSNTEFQLKINDGLYNVMNGLTKSAFTAGSNITITPVVSSDGATTTYTIAANVGGATIAISQVTDLQSTLDAKQTTTLTNGHILVGNGSNVVTSVAMSGDVTIANTGATIVGAINGATLGTTTATSGNILIGSGSAWVTHAVSGDATISNTGVLTLASSGVSASTYTSVTVDAKGRVTGGTNPGFITANQTITLTGDVTGTGTTGIATTIANGAIVAAYMASNSVPTAAIQNGALTTPKYANTSIPTTAYQAGSVTGSSSGVIALNTITMDNMAADLKIGFFQIEVSFAADGTGGIPIYLPFGGSVTLVNVAAVVVGTVAGTDAGSITFTNSVGGIMGGSIAIPASSALGYTPAVCTLSGTNILVAGSFLTVTTAKTTAGGKVLLTINYTRA